MKSDNFKRFHLKPFLIEALSAQGFIYPTDIQERLIPAIRNGRDVIGQSQTGTGKTLAFLLPVIDRLDPAKQEVQAVITAPTRELAGQLFEELKKIIAFSPEPIQARLLVGGTEKTRAIEKLKVQPQIVVGTAGRLTDLLDEQALHLHTTNMLVVDEADQMLDMGFIADVDKLAARMAEDLQMLVFSATIPEKLEPFLKKYMNQPRHVQVEPKQVSAKEIEHRLVPLRHRDRLSVVVEASRLLNPYLAIIFTNTKDEAEEVAEAMLAAGLNVERLHGGLKPRERKQVMKHVKELRMQYIVATDLAARGMDVKGVTHIINYNLPRDLDFYIHRVGRTARAGADGLAFSLVEQSDQRAVEALLKRGIPFTYYDIKNGEWRKLDKPPLGVPGKGRARRTAQAGERIHKPKKIKPAYKKKARFKQEQQARRQKKAEIKENGLNSKKEVKK